MRQEMMRTKISDQVALVSHKESSNPKINFVRLTNKINYLFLKKGEHL